jgi:SAM-dependent methyltransferase
MLEACSASLSEWDRPRVRLAILDAREPVLHESDIDLVTSSAMVQWFPDLGSHLGAVHNLLLPGGYYLLSGFCHSNFPELDQILSAEPFSYPPPPGHFLSNAVQFAQDAGFSVQLQEQDTIELAYPSALEFLRAIAQAGASRTPRDGKPLTRSALSTLVDRYQQTATLPDGRVRATWKPWYLLLKRD